MAQAAETTNHEFNLHRSNINIPHISPKSVAKIARLSRATLNTKAANYIVPPTFGTGKHSASSPTIAFGTIILNNLLAFVFSLIKRSIERFTLMCWYIY